MISKSITIIYHDPKSLSDCMCICCCRIANCIYYLTALKCNQQLLLSQSLSSLSTSSPFPLLSLLPLTICQFFLHFTVTMCNTRLNISIVSCSYPLVEISLFNMLDFSPYGLTFLDAQLRKLLASIVASSEKNKKLRSVKQNVVSRCVIFACLQ